MPQSAEQFCLDSCPEALRGQAVCQGLADVCEGQAITPQAAYLRLLWFLEAVTEQSLLSSSRPTRIAKEEPSPQRAVGVHSTLEGGACTVEEDTFGVLPHGRVPGTVLVSPLSPEQPYYEVKVMHSLPAVEIGLVSPGKCPDTPEDEVAEGSGFTSAGERVWLSTSEGTIHTQTAGEKPVVRFLHTRVEEGDTIGCGMVMDTMFYEQDGGSKKYGGYVIFTHNGRFLQRVAFAPSGMPLSPRVRLLTNVERVKITVYQQWPPGLQALGQGRAPSARLPPEIDCPPDGLAFDQEGFDLLWQVYLTAAGMGLAEEVQEYQRYVLLKAVLRQLLALASSTPADPRMLRAGRLPVVKRVFSYVCELLDGPSRPGLSWMPVARAILCQTDVYFPRVSQKCRALQALVAQPSPKPTPSEQLLSNELLAAVQDMDLVSMLAEVSAGDAVTQGTWLEAGETYVSLLRLLAQAALVELTATVEDISQLPAEGDGPGLPLLLGRPASPVVRALCAVQSHLFSWALAMYREEAPVEDGSAYVPMLCEYLDLLLPLLEQAVDLVCFSAADACRPAALVNSLRSGLLGRVLLDLLLYLRLDHVKVAELRDVVQPFLVATSAHMDRLNDLVLPEGATTASRPSSSQAQERAMMRWVRATPLCGTVQYEETFECYGACTFAVTLTPYRSGQECAIEFTEWNLHNETSPPIRFRGTPGTLQFPESFVFDSSQKLTVRLTASSAGGEGSTPGPALSVAARRRHSQLALCWVEEARLNTFLALGEYFRESLDALNPLSGNQAWSSVGAVDRLLER